MNYTIEEMITKAERALVHMRVALSFVESGVKPPAKYDIHTFALELGQCAFSIRSKVEHQNASTGLVGAGKGPFVGVDHGIDEGSTEWESDLYSQSGEASQDY